MFGDIHDLIGRCIKREEKAWGKFIERFSGLLYYSARQRLKRSGMAFGQQDLEDIVQDVFLEIWEKGRLEQVRDRSRIKAWLSVMSQTRALNYMRKKKEKLLRQEELFILDNIQADTYAEDDDALILELEKTIENLEPREKIILKLNMVHGKTHKEIAGFMKLPVNTVSTIIARKKKALEKLLKKSCPVPKI